MFGPTTPFLRPEGAASVSNHAREQCPASLEHTIASPAGAHGFVKLTPAPCESHRNGIQLDKPFASVVCAEALLGFGSRKVGRPRVLVSLGFAPV